jgi:hypothetical protein
MRVDREFLEKSMTWFVFAALGVLVAFKLMEVFS